MGFLYRLLGNVRWCSAYERSPHLMSIQTIIPKLNRVKRSQNGFVAQCPSHQDEHQSLSVTETSDRTLIKCFAGCSTESIINQLGIEWKHLFQDHSPTGHHSVDGVGIAGRPAPKIKAVYRYT